MFVALPILLGILVLTLITVGYRVRRRVIEHEPPPPNIRPDDRPMTAHPDLTNPGISQPEFQNRPWNTPERRI